MLNPNSILQNDPDSQRSRLLDHVPAENREVILRTLEFATEIHKGQFRHSADPSQPIPYIVHPIRVARILMEEWGQNERITLQAALLHDVLEDCKAEDRLAVEQDLAHRFGNSLLHAVNLLTKPLIVPAEVKAARDARYFKELFAAPIWVKYVKCADRVDNLRDACAWGDPTFWNRYSSETIGWHLYLAQETAPIVVVALFKALVDGERTIRGRVPVWADGHLIDPMAAAIIPEHIARAHHVIGLALQGETLIVGMALSRPPAEASTVDVYLRSLNRTIHTVRVIPISPEAVDDALNARLYGSIDPQ